jgi:PAS domain-containing protein
MNATGDALMPDKWRYRCMTLYDALGTVQHVAATRAGVSHSGLAGDSWLQSAGYLHRERVRVPDCPGSAAGGGQRMTGLGVDFEDVFRHLPIPVLLMTPDFDIADTNLAYLQVAGRTREELLGRNVFEAFPDNPSDPNASGVRDLGESLRRVRATGASDTLAFQQYDVEVPGRPGVPSCPSRFRPPF